MPKNTYQNLAQQNPLEPLDIWKLFLLNLMVLQTRFQSSIMTLKGMLAKTSLKESQREVEK